jgi:hypothetical protein
MAGVAGVGRSRVEGGTMWNAVGGGVAGMGKSRIGGGMAGRSAVRRRAVRGGVA